MPRAERGRSRAIVTLLRAKHCSTRAKKDRSRAEWGQYSYGASCEINRFSLGNSRDSYGASRQINRFSCETLLLSRDFYTSSCETLLNSREEGPLSRDSHTNACGNHTSSRGKGTDSCEALPNACGTHPIKEELFKKGDGNLVWCRTPKVRFSL